MYMVRMKQPESVIRPVYLSKEMAVSTIALESMYGAE